MENNELKQDVLEHVLLRMENQWDPEREKMTTAQQEQWIMSYIIEIMQRVKHYLHRRKLPKELSNVLTAMTCDLLRAEMQFDKEALPGRLQGMGLGDAQITFAGFDNVQNTMNNIVKAYKSDLHYYRTMAL